MPATLWLLAFATVLATVISVPLATIAATRRNAVRDHVIRAIPLVGLGMPPFWVGILLILALALTLHAFPVGGYGHGIAGHLRSMFLPGLTVAIGISPLLIRSLRASMLNVLESEYVTTARAKGLPAHRLLLRHVLHNAVIPAVTVLGINIGFLVGGTLVVENVFALPGIGSLMLTAIFNRDFPVVQAVTLVFGVLVVTVNLLTDVTYALLDPRVRFD
jgi:peptide/nickel transport system permease protein